MIWVATLMGFMSGLMFIASFGPSGSMDVSSRLAIASAVFAVAAVIALK